MRRFHIALAVADLQTSIEDGARYAADIWVVPTGGGEARPLVTNPANDRSPRWSPDGRTLAFLSNRSGKNQIWILESEGEPWQLTDSVTDVGGFVWSRDGRRIAFTGATQKQELWVIRNLLSELAGAR